MRRRLKCMIFNNSKKSHFTSDLKLKGERLQVVEEAKLLGTIITNDLKWNKNTQKLVKDANSKIRMLHIASKFMNNKEDLLHIYKTFIRSRLEFSCTVWHSSLSKNNVTDIERVQKSAVRLILKDKYNDYKTALKLLNLESLFERRERLCLRFAKKCLRMDNFKKLFPVRKVNHEMKKRKSEKYLIKHINTERYMKSSIPAMQRLLNLEELKMTSLLNSINSGTREHCYFNTISVKI